MFSKEGGTPNGKIYKALASAVEMAGIPKCTSHDFRATWATEMIADGTDIETARAFGGWKDLSTILRYKEVVPEKAEDAVKRLDGKYLTEEQRKRKKL